MKIELKRRTPEESREYLMIKIAELLSKNRELRMNLAMVLKWYMHPNPPHDMLYKAKIALGGESDEMDKA